MEELSIPRSPNHHYHHQLLFPEIEHHQPLITSAALSPFLRGPMYTAYADLRDWKLRMKKAGLSPSTPIPLQLKRPAVMAPIPVRSVSPFRKDGTKTRPPVLQRFDPSKTPSPETQRFDRFKMISPPLINNETKRNLPSGRGGDDKRGGPPRSGSGRADEFLLMRGFSSYDESASRNKEEGERGRSANKGIFRKTFTGFRRPTAKTNTSLA